MTNSNTRILLIDDEIDCLQQQRSSLESDSSNWTIEISNNPLEALESIKENPPTVVISDYHMPQINGAELLRQAESHHPFIHRFITAKRDELEILEDGIGSAFHFIPKPCPSERLKTEVQRCLAIENWLGKAQIKQIARSLGELPSLPSLYLKIVDALNDPDVSIDLVGKAIATDITISAKILQIVNSSYFGFDETISDITQAVSVLGIDTVKNLVLAIQVFSEQGADGQKALTDTLWRHSMNVAVGAKRLTQYENSTNALAERAYTAGLFHDIGKLIMMRAAPDAYREALELAEKKNVPSWVAESEILGCHHAEAGAYLLARWGLPIEVVESAALHHDPVNASGDSFSALAAVFATNTLLGDSDTKDFSDPESPYNHTFIQEIGKSDQWDIWEKILSDSDDPTLANNEPSTTRSTPQGSKFDQEVDHSSLTVGERPETPPTTQMSVKNRIISVTCAAACVAFAGYLAIGKFSISPSASISDWEDGSFETAQSSANASDFDYDREKSEFEPIAAEALIAESNLTEFQTISAEELIAESHVESRDAVLFPKLRLTRIYHDLPIPVANVNSALVRIGDRVSGAQVIDINQKNIVVQVEGERKIYSLK